MWTPYTEEWSINKKAEPHTLDTAEIMRHMTLEQLKSLMADGTPVYYIRQEHIFESSIASIFATRQDTYVTLDDGTMLNTANFGRVAFWGMSEAEEALSKEETNA